MRSRVYILLLLLLSAGFSATLAQEVSVKAVFDTSRIYIGDQINYTVTVDQPAEISLNLATHKDTLLKNIEILSGPVADTLSLNDSRIRIINRYLVTSFDSGFYEIPPTYAELSTETGLKRFYSEYAPLEVMRVRIAPSDTTAQIYDIIGPYKAPLTAGEVLPWVLLAALAAALVWVIIRLMKRFRKTKPGYEPVVIKEPAHVIAFRNLEKMKEAKLWQKGEVKEYYSRLTEILRQYLEDRYRVYSLELTTSETLHELLKTGFKKDDNFNRLKNILNGSDLVKFAKYKPDPSENDLHYENAWQFVDITKLKEELKEEMKEQVEGNSIKEKKE